MNVATQNIKLKKDILRMKMSRRNKTFLGMFLSFCVITLLCKIIDGVLLDVGWLDGKVHLGFWTDPNWIPKDDNDPAYSWAQQTQNHHPNTIWFITQFTWITTIMIMMFLSIRLFKYDGKTPRWLKWIMTQRTLSWVASFDIVVCIVFWAGMFEGFSKNFNPDLYYFELTYTIFVHAVIPFFITIYALIYLIRDSKASLLRGAFIWRGMIYITSYILFYMLLTIIWDDPYPVTSMHQALIKGGWNAWASELWKLPAAFLGVYTILGAMFITHNFILLRFNRHYHADRDYEAWLTKDELIHKYQKQVKKDIMKQLKKSSKQI